MEVFLSNLIQFNIFTMLKKGLENKVRAEWLTAIYTVAPTPVV